MDKPILKESPEYTLIPSQKIPHRCPICNGTGIVPHEFYGYSSSNPTEKCRTCMGIGIVWG